MLDSIPLTAAICLGRYGAHLISWFGKRGQMRCEMCHYEIASIVTCGIEIVSWRNDANFCAYVGNSDGGTIRAQSISRAGFQRFREHVRRVDRRSGIG